MHCVFCCFFIGMTARTCVYFWFMFKCWWLAIKTWHIRDFFFLLSSAAVFGCFFLLIEIPLNLTKINLRETLCFFVLWRPLFWCSSSMENDIYIVQYKYICSVCLEMKLNFIAWCKIDGGRVATTTEEEKKNRILCSVSKRKVIVCVRVCVWLDGRNRARNKRFSNLWCTLTSIYWQSV